MLKDPLFWFGAVLRISIIVAVVGLALAFEHNSMAALAVGLIGCIALAGSVLAKWFIDLQASANRLQASIDRLEAERCSAAGDKS